MKSNVEGAKKTLGKRCSICGRSAREVLRVNSYRNRFGSNRKLFPCSICQVKFGLADNVELYVKRRLRDVVKYALEGKCQWGVVVAYKKELQEHNWNVWSILEWFELMNLSYDRRYVMGKANVSGSLEYDKYREKGYLRARGYLSEHIGYNEYPRMTKENFTKYYFGRVCERNNVDADPTRNLISFRNRVSTGIVNYFGVSIDERPGGREKRRRIRRSDWQRQIIPPLNILEERW